MFRDVVFCNPQYHPEGAVAFRPLNQPK